MIPAEAVQAWPRRTTGAAARLGEDERRGATHQPYKPDCKDCVRCEGPGGLNDPGPSGWTRGHCAAAGHDLCGIEGP